MRPTKRIRRPDISAHRKVSTVTPFGGIIVMEQAARKGPRRCREVSRHVAQFSGHVVRFVHQPPAPPGVGQSIKPQRAAEPPAEPTAIGRYEYETSSWRGRIH